MNLWMVKGLNNIQVVNKNMKNSFWGNANQNHNEVPLYSPQDGYKFLGFFFNLNLFILIGG